MSNGRNLVNPCFLQLPNGGIDLKFLKVSLACNIGRKWGNAVILREAEEIEIKKRREGIIIEKEMDLRIFMAVENSELWS